MVYIILSLVLIVASIMILRKRTDQITATVFPESWRRILETHVLFYHNLSNEDKGRFEVDIMRFLKKVRITGIETEIDITDKLLVASSASIPVFGFPDWDYTFLDEVLVYPGSFDSKYNINSKEEFITGMVGTGTMEGKMILSKPALRRGFENGTDKHNVGVHEFIHLFDKEDGSIDGIPATLHNKQFALPWLKLISDKTKQITKGNDINPYAATNEREFLAVVGEYFFERPQLLKQNHPDLYELLSKAFNQDAAALMKKSNLVSAEIERNDPCPCGSGLKFKKCCMTKK